jgi:hypothetical protein
MSEPSTFGTIWRRIRRGGELRPGLCLCASAAMASLLAGLGLGIGWLVPTLVGGDVRDDHLVAGAVVATVVWLVALVYIWRPAVRLRRDASGPKGEATWHAPLLVTVGAVGVATVGTFLIQRRGFMLDDEQWAVLAVWLVAAAIAIGGWLPTIFRMERPRPVVGPSGRVNLACPECGYEMVGLRESTCPECGAQYTIDELFRAQGYRGSSDE